MSDIILEAEQTETIRPDISHLITEDDTPVDNIFTEKQQRLLTSPLYDSWVGPGDGRKFVTFANVGLFYTTNRPAVVPDALLSLDAEQSAERERQRANEAEKSAELERQRADRLAAQLRALGVDPDASG